MKDLYDAVLAAGEGHGLVHFGARAMNVMRIEKAYKAQGSELTTEITPVEADIMRFVNMDKDFQGKTATAERMDTDLDMICVYAELDADDTDAAGNEPTFDGDRVMGVTTSGCYGHSVDKSLLFAYVEPQFAAPGSTFDVKVMGHMRKATVLAEPAWDAASERLRV